VPCAWRGSAVVAALAVAACGNSDDDDAADPTTAATSPAATAAPTDAPAPTTADPGTATTAPAATEPAGGDDTVPTTEPAGPAEPELGEFQPLEGVPGVTDDTIGFAVMGTGAGNPMGYCLLACYADGVEAYLAYRNSIGGVHGRELLVTEIVDDELANTQVKLLELIGKSDLFGIFAAPLLYTGFADVNAAGVPLYSTYVAASESGGMDGVFLPATPQCLDCTRQVLAYQAKLGGATKVASLGFGISQASKDCVKYNEATFDRWGPSLGIEFVYSNDTLPYGLPNGLAPEVTAMKDAGVDFITTCIDQNSVLALKQELQRQGMTDTHVLLPQGYADEAYISGNADLLDGDVLGVLFRPFEANSGDTMLATMLEWFESTDAELNDFTVQGWISADMAVTGLLAAGPQFDRASVIAATNQITGYTAGGLLPPVNFPLWHDAPTPETIGDVSPLDCMATVIVRNGGFELAGDPDRPFDCWDPMAEEWADPVPTSF